ncbi:MAG: DUF2281 domain-containing protein [Bacteroidota bacterium]
MDTFLLYHKLLMLSEDHKNEVSDFVDLLIAKSNQCTPSPSNKAKFGSGKGMFVMHEGFDEPLE